MKRKVPTTKMLLEHNGKNWKADEVPGFPFEGLKMKDRIKHLISEVEDLQAKCSMHNSEYRIQREEIESLKLQVARYERLIDHFTGVRQ